MLPFKLSTITGFLLLFSEDSQANGPSHVSLSNSNQHSHGHQPRSNRGATTRSTLPAWTLPLIGAPSKSEQASAKRELLEAIAPLQRGLIATEKDAVLIETLTQKLEKLNPNPKSLASPLINGRWELVYTTSASILGRMKPWFLRPKGPIYQDIDAIGLRAKNSENIKPLPFVKISNSVRAALSPTSASAVNVQFLEFRVGPLKIKAPESAKGALDTTYLDQEVRVSRGDKGNLFVLTKAVGQTPDFS